MDTHPLKFGRSLILTVKNTISSWNQKSLGTTLNLPLKRPQINSDEKLSPLKVHRPRVWFISWYSTVIIVFMSGNPMITFLLSLKKKKSWRKNKWYVCCQCKIRLHMVFLFLFPGREKNKAQCTVMLECVTTNNQKTGFTKLLLLWAQCGFQKRYCHDYAYSH